MYMLRQWLPSNLSYSAQMQSLEQMFGRCKLHKSKAFPLLRLDTDYA